MLYPTLRLDGCIDPGSGGSYKLVSNRLPVSKIIKYEPAAAAGSTAFLASAEGVAEDLAWVGLLLRRRELSGERERRCSSRRSSRRSSRPSRRSSRRSSRGRSSQRDLPEVPEERSRSSRRRLSLLLSSRGSLGSSHLLRFLRSGEPSVILVVVAGRVDSWVRVRIVRRCFCVCCPLVSVVRRCVGLAKKW